MANAPADDEDRSVVRQEVACRSPARRGFWEATVAKSVVACGGLARIGRIFSVDAGF